MKMPFRQTIFVAAALGALFSAILVSYSAFGPGWGYMRAFRENDFPVKEESDSSGARPQKKDSAQDISINPRAFVLVLVDPGGGEEVLAQKDGDLPLPIASVTKLVTALAAENFFAPREAISITEGVLKGRVGSGHFRAGDEYLADDLMRAMLIESNNDAAEAFAQKKGSAEFLEGMNAVADSLGLEKTEFVNPSGLDGARINLASARDISRIMKEIFLRHPRIASVLGLAESEICTAEGKSCYIATTTNALLRDPAFLVRIQGGKTGDTPRAGKNLALAVKAPAPGWIFISVVLGSRDHFEDTKKIFEWAEETYIWPSR